MVHSQPCPQQPRENGPGFCTAEPGLCRTSALSLSVNTQCPEWSVAMLGANEAFKLRNAERAAKQAKAGLWKNHVAPASAGSRLSDRFQGPVVEVVSGDCLVVLDTASGAQHTPAPPVRAVAFVSLAWWT